MEATTEPLVEKIYYDNCKGCMQEKQKELHLEIPFREFLCMSVVTLCYVLHSSSIHPYLYFMIRDLHIAKIEEDIGLYAGFVGSASLFGVVCTSVFWGIMADRYGRKPVVVINLISVIVFNTLFGFSTNYWIVLTLRALLGIFSSLLGPIKAYASEVCRKEHEALGLSIVVTSLNIGSVIGSAIGGFLSQPAENFPAIFSKDSLFGRFPYILPCLCISLIAVGALIMTYFWFPETLHTHNEMKMEGDKFENLEYSSVGYDGKGNTRENGGVTLKSMKSLINNRSLVSTVIVYAAFSLQEMAYTEIFSLWAVSNKSYGGLSFSSRQVGQVLAISGFALLFYQLVLYPCFIKYMNIVTLFRVSAILSVPLLTSYPFMSKLSGFSLLLAVNGASFLMNLFSVINMTALNMLLNNAVSQHQRAAANGVSLLAASLFRAVGSAGGGAIVSWAQKNQRSYFLPGDHIVFFVLNVVTLIGLALSFNPSITQPGIKVARGGAYCRDSAE